eukprot:2001491-Pyramimonas_sp.AAC.2
MGAWRTRTARLLLTGVVPALKIFDRRKKARFVPRSSQLCVFCFPPGYEYNWIVSPYDPIRYDCSQVRSCRGIQSVIRIL